MSEVYRKVQTFLKLKNLAEGTQYRYLRFIDRFIDFRAPKPVEKTKRKHLLRYLARLAHQGLAPSTIKGHQAALVFLFRDVLDRPRVVRNIPWPRLGSFLPDIWTPVELEQLFMAIPQLNYRCFVMALYGTGMRISELCKLHIADIDGQRRLIHIRRSKHNKERFIPLSDELRQQLRLHYRTSRPAGPFLFPGRNGAPHVTRHTIRKVIATAAARTGIPKTITPHTLRHCYATTLLELGTDLRTIQVLLGHSSIETTSRYLHMTTAHLGQLASPLALIQLPDLHPEVRP